MLVLSAPLCLITLACTAAALGQTPGREVTGRAEKQIENNKDIHNPWNDYARWELMQAAVYDAVEKGAAAEIRSETYALVDETTAGGTQEHFERFINSTLQRYRVTWQRTSEKYDFAKLGPKRWQCSVRGIVTTIPQDAPLPEYEPLVTPLPDRNVVTRKSFNKVFINIPRDRLEGYQLVVYGEKKKNTLEGYTSYKKVKALLRVERVGDDFSTARIVKGVANVKKLDEVEARGFNRSRTGISYEYSIDNDTRTLSYTPNFEVHSLSFYTQSYYSRVGFNLGMELYECWSYRPGEIYYLGAPYLGFSYAIGLIPDLLYVQPAIAFGWILPSEILEDRYWGKPQGVWGFPLTVNSRLGGALRIKKLEITAGVAYRYANDYPTITSFYPWIGARLNFNRY